MTMFAAPASRTSRQVQVALGHWQWLLRCTGSRKLSGVPAAAIVPSLGTKHGAFGVRASVTALTIRQVCFHGRACPDRSEESASLTVECLSACILVCGGPIHTMSCSNYSPLSCGIIIIITVLVIILSAIFSECFMELNARETKFRVTRRPQHWEHFSFP